MLSIVLPLQSKVVSIHPEARKAPQHCLNSFCKTIGSAVPLPIPNSKINDTTKTTKNITIKINFSIASTQFPFYNIFYKYLYLQVSNLVVLVCQG